MQNYLTEKILREINTFVASFVKTVLSRNFLSKMCFSIKNAEILVNALVSFSKNDSVAIQFLKQNFLMAMSLKLSISDQG